MRAFDDQARRRGRLTAPTVLIAATLALAGVLVACADQSTGEDCSSDEDCDGARSCEAARCVDAGPTALPIALRVAPRVDSGLLPQQFARLDPTAGEVRLRPTLWVRGVMRPAEDTFTVNVPGDLEFRAEGLIPGLTQRFAARSREGVDAAGDGFRIALLAGLDYRVTFVPSDASWARAFFELTAGELPVSGARFAPDQLSLPSPRATLTLVGRVETLTGQPVAQARVAAFTPRGELLGVTLTDAAQGSFAMPIAPRYPEVSLRIEPPETGPGFPEYRLETVVVATPAIVRLPFDVDQTAMFEARVRVLGGPEGAPVAGVPLTVVGLLAEGTVRATAVTDINGQARLRTFAGAYECLVAVPVGDPWASWHGYVTLGPELSGITEPEIRLALRPALDVDALTHDGATVAGGSITFERDPGPSTGVLAIAPEPLVVELDAEGRARATLEPGTYTLRHAPSGGSGAPMAFRSGFEVGASSRALLWRLPRPSPLALTVTGPDGAPLADATVELWVPSTSGADARLLGRTLTDAGGALQVLVPHVEASP